MQEGKEQESIVTDLYIRIPSDLFGERHVYNAPTVSISSLPVRNTRRSAGIYPTPRPLVEKQPWAYQEQCHANKLSSVGVKHHSFTGQPKDLLALGCSYSDLHGHPRRLKHAQSYVNVPRWLEWEEAGVAAAIRMQTSHSLASFGGGVVYDDLDMIEMVAKANSIRVEAERRLPGLRGRQCALRSRPDEVTEERPPRDPRTATLPSFGAPFTRDQRMRSDQAEPHRHVECPALDHRHALLAGSDRADVTSGAMSRPPAEMTSREVVMMWLLDGSVPAGKSNFLPVIQAGKKKHKSPR